MQAPVGPIISRSIHRTSPALSELNTNTDTDTSSASSLEVRETPQYGRYQDREVVIKNFRGEECGKVTLPGSVFDVPIRKDIVHSVVKWQLAKRRSGTASTLAVGEVQGTSRKPWQQKGSGRARQGSLRGPHFRGGATMHGPKPRSYDYPLQKKVRRLGLRIALSSRLAEGKLSVYQDLDPNTKKTKEMAKLLATAFPDSKKLLLVDQLSRPGPKAAAGTGSNPQAASSEAEEEHPKDPIPQAKTDVVETASSESQMAAAASPLPLRPLTKQQMRIAKQKERRKQRSLQKVSEKLVKVTNNLHYVNVLPTLGLNVYSILQHDTLVMSLAALQGTIQRLQPKFLSRREKRLLALQAAKAEHVQQEGKKDGGAVL